MEPRILYFVSVYSHESYDLPVVTDGLVGIWGLFSRVDLLKPTLSGLIRSTQSTEVMSTPHANPSGQAVLEVSENWLQVDGLQMRFWRAGLGPPVVLVHGLLGYAFSWRRVIPILARESEVFAPDMPGAGFSECRSGLDFRLAGAARRLRAFLDAAGVGSCDLVGSSYGGSTAVMLAGMAPSRVRSLVLVSPANPWSRIGKKRLAMLKNPLIAAVFPMLARAARPLHRYFIRRMWGDPRLAPQETLDGYIRPLVRPGVFEHAGKIVQSWHADMKELESTLPKIAGIPTFLVWGSKDRVVDPESTEIMAKRVAGARVAVMRGAGHLPYEENPQEFSRIVSAFFRDVRSTDTARPARSVT